MRIYPPIYNPSTKGYSDVYAMHKTQEASNACFENAMADGDLCWSEATQTTCKMRVAGKSVTRYAIVYNY